MIIYILKDLQDYFGVSIAFGDTWEEEDVASGILREAGDCFLSTRVGGGCLVFFALLGWF